MNGDSRRGTYVNVTWCRSTQFQNIQVRRVRALFCSKYINRSVIPCSFDLVLHMKIPSILDYDEVCKGWNSVMLILRVLDDCHRWWMVNNTKIYFLCVAYLSKLSYTSIARIYVTFRHLGILYRTRHMVYIASFSQYNKHTSNLDKIIRETLCTSVDKCLSEEKTARGFPLTKNCLYLMTIWKFELQMHHDSVSNTDRLFCQRIRDVSFKHGVSWFY